MQLLNDWMTLINAVLWHDYVLITILGVGVLFTIWSGFSQWHALTHGVAITRGTYDEESDPGAINHFQALSTALSATVGLGNIGGVALAAHGGHLRRSPMTNICALCIQCCFIGRYHNRSARPCAIWLSTPHQL